MFGQTFKNVESMVLYSKIRLYLMKVINCDFQGICSADIYPLLSFKGKMTKDFLYHLLLTKDFTDYAIVGSQRAGMLKVNCESFCLQILAPARLCSKFSRSKIKWHFRREQKIRSHIYMQKLDD